MEAFQPSNLNSPAECPARPKGNKVNSKQSVSAFQVLFNVHTYKMCQLCQKQHTGFLLSCLIKVFVSICRQVVQNHLGRICTELSPHCLCPKQCRREPHRLPPKQCQWEVMFLVPQSQVMMYVNVLCVWPQSYTVNHWELSCTTRVFWVKLEVIALKKGWTYFLEHWMMFFSKTCCCLHTGFAVLCNVMV